MSISREVYTSRKGYCYVNTGGVIRAAKQYL